MVRILVCLALMCLPTAVSAEWRKAESTNYIAYSTGDAADLRKRVATLERFGQVLQALTGARRPKDVPVKITIYFVRTFDDVAESLPYPSAGVAGYYNTTMRGPFAVMPRLQDKEDRGSRYRMPELASETVLRHELTHHFMFQYFPAAYPAWYTEGFADYVGAIRLSDDDVATLGEFLPQRAQALRAMEWVPIRQLMDPRPGSSTFDRFAFYSQGWIIVHYFNQDEEKRNILRGYLSAINKGASPAEAMKQLGDLDKLDRELRVYAHRSTLPATQVRYAALDPGPIVASELTPAQQEAVAIEMRLSSGVAQSGAQQFVRSVRATAARYPDDADLMRLQIDAERLTGNRPQAIALTDRWLAKEPTNPWALFNKGDLAAETLAAAKSTDAQAWSAARASVAAAIKLKPNQPRFLRAYYNSYALAGGLPPAGAQNRLAEAVDLIPSQDELRHQLAADYEQRGLVDDAIYTIAPIAYGRNDEDESTKRSRLRQRKEYAEAGQEIVEEPRAMLARLLAKKQASVSPTSGPSSPRS